MPTAGLDNLEIVLVDFLGALGRGDHAAMRALLAPDVTWQGLREDWVCHGPDPVVDTLLGGFEHGRPVAALEFVQAGDHVVMGVRSSRLDAIDASRSAGRSTTSSQCRTAGSPGSGTTGTDWKPSKPPEPPTLAGGEPGSSPIVSTKSRRSQTCGFFFWPGF